MRRLGRAVALAGAVLAFTAPEAPAAATRAEYAAQVNPICVETGREIINASKRADRQAKGIGGDPAELSPEQRKRLLRAVGQLLKKQAVISQRGIARIGAVLPAPGDESIAFQFVSALKAGNRNLRRSGEALVRFIKAVPPEFEGDELAELPKKAIRAFARFLLLALKSEEIIQRSDAAATQLGLTECVSDPRAFGGGQATASRIAELTAP